MVIILKKTLLCQTWACWGLCTKDYKHAIMKAIARMRIGNTISSYVHSWVTEIFLASEDASLFISIIKDFGVPPDWAWTSFEIASKGRVMQWTEKITKASNYLSTWWRFFEWVIEHIHQCSSGLCKQRVEWGLFPFYAKCRKQNPVKTWDLILYLRWLVESFWSYPTEISQLASEQDYCKWVDT